MSQPPYPHPQQPASPPPGPSWPAPGRPPPPPGWPPPGWPPPQPAISPAAGAHAFVEAIEGTNYGLAYPAVHPLTSGPAVGSMVAGIASDLVASVTLCLGLLGTGGGWGPLVAGAFAILAVLLGAAAILTSRAAKRRIRAAGGALTGGGMATAGLVCGSIGAGIAGLAFLLSALITYA